MAEEQTKKVRFVRNWRDPMGGDAAYNGDEAELRLDVAGRAVGSGAAIEVDDLEELTHDDLDEVARSAGVSLVGKKTKAEKAETIEKGE